MMARARLSWLLRIAKDPLIFSLFLSLFVFLFHDNRQERREEKRREAIMIVRRKNLQLTSGGRDGVSHRRNWFCRKLLRVFTAFA